MLIKAERRQARSSAAVIGRRSVSVPGFGMGILDIWCAGWGIVRMARDIVMMLVSVWGHGSGRRAKILIENCRWRLLLGMIRMVVRRVVMYAGAGECGCT